MSTALNTGIKTIVLAEDDADDQNIFQLALQEVNRQIKFDLVINGTQLLSLLSNFLPDLIFLDLDMPYKNGLECLLEIRNNPLLENLAIVVFSSTTRPSNIQTAYEMGANLFFIKPSVYHEFVSSINAIINLNWKDPVAIREKYCVNGRYVAFT